MNKVFLLAAQEDWIVDRFVNEWNLDNQDITTKNPYNADVIWLFASWCWKHIPHDLLKSKKVITTIHHIVPEKFDTVAQQDFLFRDSVTTCYHVYNESTKTFVERLTNKPVNVIPYWANQKIWRVTSTKQDVRKKYNLNIDDFIVGSFQRDTEGYDLKSPKLEKGPDLLVDYLDNLYQNQKNLHVVLAGWRRQYVISRLQGLGIPFTYFERPQHDVINELYQSLDLYPVTSRCEGGPQSLIECGLLSVPVVSRDVGIAKQVLLKESISNDIKLAKPSVPNVEGWMLPHGYEPYRNLIVGL